jgi:hypothetical protein
MNRHPFSHYHLAERLVAGVVVAIGVGGIKLVAWLVG